MSRKTKKDGAQPDEIAAVAPKIWYIDPAADGEFVEGVRCDEVTNLIDSVITSGVLGIHPRVVQRAGTEEFTDALLTAAVVKEAHDLIAYHTYDEESGEGLEFSTSVEPYSAATARETARLITVEVNDCAPRAVQEDIREQSLPAVKAALAAIEPKRNTTKVVTARAVYREEDERDGKRHVTVKQFLNTNNGLCVSFYIVEGRI